MHLDLGKPVTLRTLFFHARKARISQTVRNRAARMAMFNLTVKLPIKRSLLHSMDTL